MSKSKKKAISKAEIERLKRLAFVLYTENGFDQKVIASITHVSENSITAWKKKDAASGLDWDEERQFNLMGPEKTMRRIMRRYDKMLDDIEKANRNPTNSEADVMNKLADSVKKLRTELTEFVKTEVAKQCINYHQQANGQTKAIQVCEDWYEYIMATAK